MSDQAKIRKFLIEEQKMSPLGAENLLEKFEKHADIFNEFLSLIETKNFPETGVKSGSYSAKSLSRELPHLPPQVIYEFLVGLRDEPEKFESYIKEGVPIL